MNWPTISLKEREKLIVLRFVAAKKDRFFRFHANKAFIKVDKEFVRIIKMLRLGRELRPSSYKYLTVAHKNYGTDAWEVHIAAGVGSKYILKADNRSSFNYWVQSMMTMEPSTAYWIMKEFPNVRIP